MSDFTVEELQEPTPQDAESIRSLTKELGDSFTLLSDKEFEEMITSAGNHLLVIRDPVQKKIVGMVTVVIYRIPYTKKAYLDDFVIQKEFRNQGLGTNLFKSALALVEEQKVSYLEFTSHQSRQEGNALYHKLGFQKRDTNVYRRYFTYED